MTWKSSGSKAFPSDWYRLPRWWLSGSIELLAWILAVVATPMLLPMALGAVKHRTDPVKLFRYTVEPAVAGLFVSIGMLVMLIRGKGPWWTQFWVLPWWAPLWFVTGVLVTGCFVGVLVVSRIRHPVLWLQLDFIARHDIGDHAPQTVDQYRAVQLKHWLGV